MTDRNDVVDPAACDRLVRIGGAKLAIQMIELFLLHGPERIRKVEEGYASQDLREVEQGAHSMKSSAGNLGATRMQASANRVETLAEDGGSDKLGAEVEMLRAEYDAAVEALTRRLAELQS